MAGEEAALNLLGGLLALPLSIPQQRAQQQQQAQVQQALTSSHGQITPEVTQALTAAMMPAQYKPAGSDVPGIGPVLGGLSTVVGTTGRVLQTLAGGGPAPRPNDFLNGLKQISELKKSQAASEAAPMFTKPLARKLAEAGDLSGATKVETGGGGKTSLYDRWLQDPQKVEAFERATHKWGQGGAGGGGGDPTEPSLKGAPSAEKDIEEHAQLQFKKDHGGLTPKEEQRLSVLDLKAQERRRLLGEKADVATNAATERKRRAQEITDHALTTATKTMIERAPKVQFLARRVQKLVTTLQQDPLTARWNDIVVGKIGAPNDAWTRLRTDVGLLETALMNMHTGARGSTELLQHFRDLMNESKQSWQNLQSAVEEVQDYATEVGHMRPESTPDPGAGGGAQTHDLGDGWSVDIH